MKTCDGCPKYGKCKTPCEEAKKVLWERGRTMERWQKDKIVIYPRNREINFSQLEIKGIDDADDFALHDTIPWSSEDRRLMKTKVFIERFFNRVPCAELAEKYGVKENTIICMYRDAVKSIEKIIAAMDARKHGLKAVKNSKRFTDDQKYFLLTYVFGFSGREVGEMFNTTRQKVDAKTRRLADRYGALFEGEQKKPFRSMYEDMTPEQIHARITCT